MDFALNDAQRDVRDLARKILEDLVSPERLRDVEAGPEGFDRALWDELARANLLGVALPEAAGGSDLGFVTLGLLLQEVGRCVAPVPVLPTLVMAALPIATYGSDSQRQHWLPRVARGEAILSAALVEFGGRDPAVPFASARRDGDGWVLHGQKECVPYARHAARILVPTSLADGGVGVFLLDPSGEGVTVEEQRTTDRQPHGRLTLEGARVAGEDLLGDPASGAQIARFTAQRAAGGLCMLQLGVSERALEMTAAYTSTREQFDRPIGSFQAVHMRAGDAYIDVEAMRLTAWQAAFAIEDGRDAADAVAVAKFWAAEGGSRAGYAAQHLHGGIGIDVDYPLHRHYLWAKQLELTLGSAAEQLERIGDALADGPPLGA